MPSPAVMPGGLPTARRRPLHPARGVRAGSRLPDVHCLIASHPHPESPRIGRGLLFLACPTPRASVLRRRPGSVFPSRAENARPSGAFPDALPHHPKAGSSPNRLRQAPARIHGARAIAFPARSRPREPPKAPGRVRPPPSARPGRTLAPPAPRRRRMNVQENFTEVPQIRKPPGGQGYPPPPPAICPGSPPADSPGGDGRPRASTRAPAAAPLPDHLPGPSWPGVRVPASAFPRPGPFDRAACPRRLSPGLPLAR